MQEQRGTSGVEYYVNTGLVGYALSSMAEPDTVPASLAIVLAARPRLLDSDVVVLADNRFGELLVGDDQHLVARILTEDRGARPRTSSQLEATLVDYLGLAVSWQTNRLRQEQHEYSQLHPSVGQFLGRSAIGRLLLPAGGARRQIIGKNTPLHTNAKEAAANWRQLQSDTGYGCSNRLVGWRDSRTPLEQ